MGTLREWAKGLSQEEQEEYLDDPLTGRVRACLQDSVARQRTNLVDQCRTRDLERLRYEAGLLDGLEQALRLIEEEKS